MNADDRASCIAAPDPSIRRWIVSQCGAREHYAVARSVHRLNQLRCMYTDVWSRLGRSVLQRGPKGLRSLAGRFHPEIPPEKVVAWSCKGIARQAARMANRHIRSAEEILAWELRYGSWYAQRVADHLARCSLEPQRDIFFGFLTQARETLWFLRDRGIASVIDQAAPGRTEDQMVLAEVAKWPGWTDQCQVFSDAYYDHLAQEWNAASLVLVNSEFSRQAMIQQGVAAEKIIVVPLAYEPTVQATARSVHDQPLTVLWLGSVIVRKGIPYLVQAARQLVDSNIRFVVAGPIGITRDALESAPPNMEFVGRVTRDQAARHYQSADVFVLPTISDGFAITQIEAMAYGVPVITTPNCGEVVTHGVDGLIVPAGDADSLAAAIAQVNGDRAMLAEMSRQALYKSRQFTVASYGERLNAQVTARSGASCSR